MDSGGGSDSVLVWLQRATSLCDGVVEIVDGFEMSIDERLVHSGPKWEEPAGCSRQAPSSESLNPCQAVSQYLATTGEAARNDPSGRVCLEIGNYSFLFSYGTQSIMIISST